MPSSSQLTRPRVLILHAYSPSNSGDGLLVKLALETIERSIGPFDFTVIASDAAGFSDDRYIQWSLSPLLSRGPGRRPGMLVASTFPGRTQAAHLAKKADLIVAVGGAYLRGGSRVESFKSWGAHFGQLKIAAKYGGKTVYLPQSIGPYAGRYQEATRRLLGKISTVFVRDDKTEAELADHVHVVRVPDMAIIEWARGYAGPAVLSDLRPVFVARDLDQPRGYYNFLADIAASDEFEWAVQATGSANNDFPVTQRFSSAPPRRLAEILAERKPRVVVSTRLHGSLSSLIAGYPTIHLTYERKGWSAFKDLGLEKYVMSARDASLAEVQQRVAEISADPSQYWGRISASVPRILESSDQLESRIRGIFQRRGAA